MLLALVLLVAYGAVDARSQSAPAQEKLLRFVLRAFIPSTDAHALVKIPTLPGVCLATDQRGFSPSLDVQSRVTTEFILVIGHSTRVAAAGSRDIFRVEPVRTVDCATARDSTPLPAPPADPMTFDTLVKYGDIAQVVFSVSVRDPFHLGTDGTDPQGELRYGGSLIYDTRTASVSFKGTISVYPAFEAFVETDQAVQMLFEVPPAPGATPASLYADPAQRERPIEVTRRVR